jgi:ABC-type multidrug transport system ATPase subunit
MVKYNKEVLILDEPEQGCDPDVAVNIISNILTLFENNTIFMISHICDCQIEKLNYNWTLKINVDDGVLSII